MRVPSVPPRHQGCDGPVPSQQGKDSWCLNEVFQVVASWGFGMPSSTGRSIETPGLDGLDGIDASGPGDWSPLDMKPLVMPF